MLYFIASLLLAQSAHIKRLLTDAFRYIFIYWLFPIFLFVELHALTVDIVLFYSYFLYFTPWTKVFFITDYLISTCLHIICLFRT